MLGSTSGPRSMIAPFIRKCKHCGVRFVYFSPRNMRRSKELASKLGLEMGWNCAISLRPLHGQEHDEHRMISSYADWDVNAKLPHGVEEIRRHVADVDNVPLLVSLFTDSTEDSTKSMVEIFKENSDTVLVLGCSHVSRNIKIFGSSDVSVGVDTVEEEDGDCNDPGVREAMRFAREVITRDCFFNIEISSLPHLHDIIAVSRASLEAAISAVQFAITCGLSLSILGFLCLCAPKSPEVFIDGGGAVLYLLLLVPALAVGISFSDGDSKSMRRCPVKDDPASAPFSGRNELAKRSLGVLSRAGMNAVGSFAVGLLATVGGEGKDGKAATMLLVELCLCSTVGAFGSLYRADVFWVEVGWRSNAVFLGVTAISLMVCLVVTFVAVEPSKVGGGEAGSAVLWPIFSLWPVLTLMIGELVFKRDIEKVIFDRAALLRRLEFETRLGMWSPR
mmetsp:Transcript_18612/g.37301  ORF Transcript_18612/g.37301 Transcript_18612/m.37301 type:complete len:448 (+) Transcript_18612:2098-3441(+)